jgi:hypothetical protein
MEIFGKLEACESCGTVKTKQKKAKKVWTGLSNVPGERI